MRSFFKNAVRSSRLMATLLSTLAVFVALLSLGTSTAQPTFKPPGPQIALPGRKSPIVLQQVNWSVWDDGRTVSLSLLLRNISKADAKDVQINAVAAGKGQYSGPDKLPLKIGRLDAGEFAVVNALFAMPADGQTQQVSVGGVASFGAVTLPFAGVRLFTPRSSRVTRTPSRRGEFTKQNARQAKFPPVREPDPRLERNAETPMLIPLGLPRSLFPPTRRPTKVQRAGTAGTIRVTDNQSTPMGLGGPPDPSAAVDAVDGVVLMTYNTGLSYSTDGGAHFTNVGLFSPQPGNPARTSFFPSSYGGLCCDQVVIYLPQQNLFVWLLQYWPVANAAGNITQPNAQRIAWARPADLRADFWNAWTWGDLTANAVPGVSSGLGAANNEWLDYPDLAYSDEYLYVSTDRGWPDGVGSIYADRRFVARLSLADMANPASGVVHYGYAELTGNGVTKSHFVQDAPRRMVVGSLDDTSTMRIFTWPDSSGSISSVTQPISSITQGANYTSIIPDASDWVAVGFPGNISGATYRRGPIGEEYLFAFDAGTNGPGRPQAYVRLESLGPSGAGYRGTAEYDIWNPDYAFAMAALGTNGSSDRPEIGMTVSVGGGTIGYPQGTVGFKDDFVLYIMTASTGSQMARYGDYFDTRPIPGAAHMFGTTLYDITVPAGSAPGSTCSTVACGSLVRYVEFGR